MIVIQNIEMQQRRYRLFEIRMKLSGNCLIASMISAINLYLIWIFSMSALAIFLAENCWQTIIGHMWMQAQIRHMVSAGSEIYIFLFYSIRTSQFKAKYCEYVECPMTGFPLVYSNMKTDFVCWSWTPQTRVIL